MQMPSKTISKLLRRVKSLLLIVPKCLNLTKENIGQAIVIRKKKINNTDVIS
jgi:hypothetical protein